jgi:hypothetical protein
MPSLLTVESGIIEQVYEISLADARSARFTTDRVKGVIKSIRVESKEHVMINSLEISYADVTVIDAVQLGPVKTFYPMIQPDTGVENQKFTFAVVEHVINDPLNIVVDGKYGDTIQVVLRYQ